MQYTCGLTTHLLEDGNLNKQNIECYITVEKFLSDLYKVKQIKWWGKKDCTEIWDGFLEYINKKPKDSISNWTEIL